MNRAADNTAHAPRRLYYPSDSNDRLWRRLLDDAMGRADSFECALPYTIVVQRLARAPLWPEAPAGLEDHVVDRYVTLIRAGYLREHPSQIVRFRLTPGLAAYIRLLGRLGSWRWEQGHPEDPAFYAGDQPILATESRQQRISVYADEADHARLAGAGVRLVEPLGLVAEPWPTP